MSNRFLYVALALTSGTLAFLLAEAFNPPSNSKSTAYPVPSTRLATPYPPQVNNYQFPSRPANGLGTGP